MPATRAGRCETEEPSPSAPSLAQVVLLTRTLGPCGSLHLPQFPSLQQPTPVGLSPCGLWETPDWILGKDP